MIKTTIGGTTITGNDIGRYRLLALRGALHLQTLGMSRRGKSASAIVKEEFGWKGSAKTLLKKLDEYLESEVKPKLGSD